MKTYRTIKEIAATAKETLKKEFPNCKFSVTTETYSGGQSLTVRLMEAPFEAFAPEDQQIYRGCGQTIDLNQYQFRTNSSGEALGFDMHGNRIPNYTCNGAVLTKEGYQLCARMCEIGLIEHWDKSNVMVDYFNCAYYFHPGIGKWDKPFKVVMKGGK